MKHERLLEVDKVRVAFGGLVAVTDASFIVRPGNIVAVIGPNGAGKTTLFNAVTGVYPPTKGVVSYRGSHLRRDFTKRTALATLLAGSGVAFLLFFALTIVPVWESSIIAHYVFEQPFPWQSAVDSAREVYRTASIELLSWLCLGFLGGAAGYLSLWQQSRSSPDFVVRRGIGRTFQNIRLFQEMSALENVMMGTHSRAAVSFWDALLRLPRFFRSDRTTRRRALELLDLVGLREDALEPAGSLPYGHQRRLEIARALATEPGLLLLDEPAAGMNPTEAGDLQDLIRKIRDSGVTVLLIEHHMDVVMGVSDHIVVLDYGHVIAQGTPDEVRANPKVIEAYLGTAKAEAVNAEGTV